MMLYIPSIHCRSNRTKVFSAPLTEHTGFRRLTRACWLSTMMTRSKAATWKRDSTCKAHAARFCQQGGRSAYYVINQHSLGSESEGIGLRGAGPPSMPPRPTLVQHLTSNNMDRMVFAVLSRSGAHQADYQVGTEQCSSSST